jgi:hypothetical protein
VRILIVLAIFGGITLALGAINIWLGVLALPITFGAAKELLSK